MTRIILATVGLFAGFYGTGFMFMAVFTAGHWMTRLLALAAGLACLAVSLWMYRRTRLPHVEASRVAEVVSQFEPQPPPNA